MRAKSLLIVTAAMAIAASGADFLPIAPGNHWIYQDAVSGQIFTVQVDATQYYINENVYHVLKGYTPQKQLVRVNEYGNIVFWDQEREAEVMLTSFEVVPGAWFEAWGRQCPEVGQPQERRVTHDGPAGGWNALEIKYASFACADAGDISEQFAENIGMVQRVVNTFAGPRTYNLIHAKLGTQLISASNPGSFSIATLPGKEPGTWTTTLRVDQPLSPMLNLRFPSGQEFDARLRDADGRVLWTWSADKLFVQAEHVVAIGNGWSASFTIPYPPAVPEGPNRYTLEAWLTNFETDPRFGAATIVEIPAPAKSGALLQN